MRRSITFLFAYGFSLITCSAQGTWTQKASFPGSARSGAVGFSIGTKGYIGTGYDTIVGFTSDFWEWDKTTNIWTQKANTPEILTEAVAFSIGNKGYIGTGFNANTYSSVTGGLYEYDPAFNAWTWKAGIGVANNCCRARATGFSIGGKGYMGTGTNNGLQTPPGTYFQDFWEYDRATDVWVQKADFPVARESAVGCSIGTKGYIGLGWNGSVLFKDFWEWDQATNVWTQKANFGGAARSRAVGFSIGKKAYVGTGYDGNVYGSQDFWEWDQNTNVWTQVANFGGVRRYGAVGFAIGYCGYVATGYGGYPWYQRDMWEYCPNGYCCNTMVANTTSQNVLCNGQCTGASTVNPSNGILPYTYNWSSGQTTQTVTGLCAGTYTATVTDSVNNIITNTITITQPALPLIHSFPPVTNVDCFGNNNGSATVNVSGGTPSYSYSWSSVPNQTTPTAAGLGPGNYTVSITDSHGCSFSDTVTITSPPLLTHSFSNVSVDCFGNNNGSAAVNAAGGTPSYIYSWNTSPVQTTQSITGLYAGVYSINVTDSHGCTFSDTAVITSPTGLGVSSPVVENVKCFGTSTGTATVTATGGTPNYTYSWNSTGQTTSTATGLSAGTDTVTITDNNGCIIKTLVSVSQPTAVTGNISADTSICSGTSAIDNISVSGGIPGYTYLWMPSGATITSITVSPPGTTTYTAQVTDANGCSSHLITTVTVVQNPAESVSYTPAFCSGSVQFMDSSASTTTWDWNFGDGGTSGVQNPVHVYSASGSYSVTLITVVGQLSCKSNNQLMVDVPPFSQLYIPNAFSPNNDNNNEMYYVSGKCVTQMTFIIYDRWGEKVFEYSGTEMNSAQGWDGKYKGQLENADVFMYDFNGTLSTGEKINKKGNITLMR